ncbi:dual specificity protein phosphatase 19 [Octopus bimaculoides]|uniref:protein-serine/threonine phosphatase n=1 Tax=Octopus bimaculoides TaxID=37653 RepID=A0A0L8IGA7_OCTBM|nr:dual specificity protein phosphatase 19 [Octopus bimaculoides]|eukprot:XP_014770907.1 PREDICTED: dual specificity protein phosphatase 19-like [Octopus bimaculoides]
MAQNLTKLHSELRKFQKDELKKTETRITTPGGQIYTENKDAAGRLTTTLTNRGRLGFVGDLRADLQVGEIRKGLVLGSQDVAQSLETLNKHNVTHILNVATGVENLYPEKFTYKSIKVYDLPDTKIVDIFDEAFAFIEEGRSSGCVLVHCNAGISRAASIVIGYLMKTEGMSFSDSFWYVKGKRPVVHPNFGFVDQLRDYEIFLRQN